jgi:hypothetical protein
VIEQKNDVTSKKGASHVDAPEPTRIGDCESRNVQPHLRPPSVIAGSQQTLYAQLINKPEKSLAGQHVDELWTACGSLRLVRHMDEAIIRAVSHLFGSAVILANAVICQIQS